MFCITSAFQEAERVLDKSRIKELSQVYPELFGKGSEEGEKKSSVDETVDLVAKLGPQVQMEVSEATECVNLDDSRFDEIIEKVVGRKPAEPYSQGTKEQMMHVKDLPRPGELCTEGGRRAKNEKRWKGHRWQLWNTSITASLRAIQEELNRV